ncbi:uncharacterized protein [Diabrotica undecimpunctata]|uniref:uncharacterized protein n=1 Tax=Diabrotica undecimpunctata TaxID=50387 RepID=UPI003B634CB4
MTRRVIGCYGVRSGETRIVREKSSGSLFPTKFDNYIVYNVGKTPVIAEGIYATKLRWHKAVTRYVLQPGESRVLEMSGVLFFEIGIRLINESTSRAIIHCADESGYVILEEGTAEKPKIDIDLVEITNNRYCMGKLCYIGDDFSKIINIFWPRSEANIWSKFQELVNDELDPTIREQVNGVLNNELKVIKEYLDSLNENIENSADLYMKTADLIFGLEKKFTFADYKNLDMNFYALPYYSALVTLQVLYYQFGIVNQKKIHLQDEHIAKIENYSKILVDFAVMWVKKVFCEELNHVYETCDANDIYNSLLAVRYLCNSHGLQFTEYWQAIVTDPFRKSRPDITSIVYTKAFGTPTPTLARQMVLLSNSQPLTPDLIDGKRNRIIEIEVYETNDKQGISGLAITYQNGDNIVQGEVKGLEGVKIDLRNNYLIRLTAAGPNRLDALSFLLDDGSTYNFGVVNGDKMIYEMWDHYISGIFIANDISKSEKHRLLSRVACITVSYQLIPQV